MDTAFLVLDAGTGSGRSLVIDSQGKILGQAYQEWGYIEVPGVEGGLELDAAQFLEILLGTASQAIHASGLTPTAIRAVAVTSQREGVVFLDRSGRVLYAGPNFDGRAAKQGERLAAQSGPEIYFRSGTYPPMYGIPARLAWFRENRPKVYEQIDATLTLGDWAVFALTGRKVTEPTLAAGTGILDIAARDWSPELISLHGIPSSWLPEVISSQQLTAGAILPSIAMRLGLPEIPVVLAGGDTQCAMLGMGLTAPDETGCVAGTTSPVQRITGKPLFDPQMRTFTTCYFPSTTWILESNAVVTGLALRWLKDSLGAGAGYDELNSRASAVPVGSRGTLAFLGAEILDLPHYQSSWTGGFLFPCPPGQIGVPEYYRAALESNAYAVRGNLEQIRDITSIPTQTLHVCGGQVASPLFNHILSSVLKMPVQIHSEQATAIGAAARAGVGTGFYAGLAEAGLRMAGGPISVEPDPHRATEYESFYQQWLETYHGLRKLTDKS